MVGGALAGLVTVTIVALAAWRWVRGSRRADEGDLALVMGARVWRLPGGLEVSGREIVADGTVDELGSVALRMFVTADGTAHGTFSTGATSRRLAGDVRLLGFELPYRRRRRKYTGVAFHVHEPLTGRIVRERQVVLGTAATGLLPKLREVLPRPAAAEPPLTAEEAVALVVGRLAASWPEAKAAPRGPLEVSIGDGVLSLHNSWPDLSGLPATEARRRLFSIVDGVVRTHRSRPTWINRQESLVVRLAPAPLSGLAHQPIAKGLVAMFAQDMPEALRWLPAEELDAMGLPDPMSVAAANLYRMQPVIRILGEGPLYMVMCGGTFEASLLVVPEVVAAMQAVVDGPLIAHVPTRDLLLFTGDTEPARRQALIRTEEELTYAISPGLFRWVDGRWEALEE
jgi:hypothetical protein